MAPPRGSFAPRGSFRGRGSFHPRGDFHSHNHFQHRGPAFNRPSEQFPPPHNEFNLTETFTVEEIAAGNVSERLIKILDCLAATAPNKAGHISLKIAASYVPPKPEIPENPIAQQHVVGDDEILKGLENALKEHLEKRKRVSGEVPVRMQTEEAEEEEDEESDDESSDESEDVPVLVKTQKRIKSESSTIEEQSQSAKKTPKQNTNGQTPGKKQKNIAVSNSPEKKKKKRNSQSQSADYLPL